MADAFEHCERAGAGGRQGPLPRHAVRAAEIPARAVSRSTPSISKSRAFAKLAREPMPGEIRLQWWRDALFGAGPGEAAAHPVAAALRDVVVRYRLPPAALADLIDARAFDLYDEPMPSARCAGELRERHVVGAVRSGGAHSARWPRQPAPTISPGMPASPMRSPGCCGRLPMHAARRQLYLPLDLMQRYGAQAEDVFAGKATTELRAALAELRLRARRHLAAAGAVARRARPQRSCRRCCRWRWCKPALDRMERRGYQPFRPSDCRNGGGNGCSGAPRGRRCGCSPSAARELTPPRPDRPRRRSSGRDRRARGR